MTDCAPHNGYFLLPIYTKGPIIIKLLPPDGWTFEPSELSFNVDGTTDVCSKGEDLNFLFKGFTVTGKVYSRGLDTGPHGVSVALIDSSNNDSGGGGNIKSTLTQSGDFTIPRVMPGTYTIQLDHPNWRLHIPVREVVVEMKNLDIATRYARFDPITAVAPLGTKFLKPHYYPGIGAFFNPINYFDYKKVKIFFSEKILIF